MTTLATVDGWERAKQALRPEQSVSFGLRGRSRVQAHAPMITKAHLMAVSLGGF
jgi:hypothetical protein